MSDGREHNHIQPALSVVDSLEVKSALKYAGVYSNATTSNIVLIGLRNVDEYVILNLPTEDSLKNQLEE